MNKEIILAPKQVARQVTLDEVAERLIFIEKVEEGPAKLDYGEFKTQEVAQLVKSWRK